MGKKLGFWSWWNEGDGVLEDLRRVGYPGSMAKHATKRVPILGFWRKFGLAATVAAFQVSRATLFRWERELHAGQAAPRVTTPVRKRHRMMDDRLTAAVVRLRTEHPRLGKEKLRPLLSAVCRDYDLRIPSVSTVGRILGDLKRAGRLPDPRRLRMSALTGKLLEKRWQRPKKRRRKGYQPHLPGDLLQLDTVVTIVNGCRRYTLTAIDLVSRFAFAWSYTTGSSKSAADFLGKLQTVAPFPLRHVQTDNGSEFHGVFDAVLTATAVPHFWNYPRYPKGNAYVERFNRTIQEECLTWHRDDLVGNLDHCNDILLDWLVWYNRDRPHAGLRQRSPLQYLQLTTESHMSWTHTVY